MVTKIHKLEMVLRDLHGKQYTCRIEWRPGEQFARKYLPDGLGFQFIEHVDNEHVEYLKEKAEAIGWD